MKSAPTPSPITRRDSLKHLIMSGAALGVTGMAMGAPNYRDTPDSIVSPNLPPLLEPFALSPLPPLQPGPGGLDIRTWVRSSRTNKQFSCVEVAASPKKMGPAPHVHADLDELMYVLEGTATVWLNGRAEEIPAGGWHFRPRKIEHTFWNGSDRPLRFIDMYFNQNFEDFLEELFHQIFPEMQKQQLTPADPGIAKRLADLDARFGITTFPEKRQPLIERFQLRP